jgi:hypothetical protein
MRVDLPLGREFYIMLATAKEGGKTVTMAVGAVEGGDDGGRAQRAC